MEGNENTSDDWLLPVGLTEADMEAHKRVAAYFKAIGFSPDCQWRPIETAPKTGERILLAADWTDKLKVKQVAYGHWYKLGPYWAYDGYQFGNPECQPTHWMPLPAPPAAGGV